MGTVLELRESAIDPPTWLGAQSLADGCLAPRKHRHGEIPCLRAASLKPCRKRLTRQRSYTSNRCGGSPWAMRVSRVRQIPAIRMLASLAVGRQPARADSLAPISRRSANRSRRGFRTPSDSTANMRMPGNAGAQQQFMNPYLSSLNPFFAQQRQQAVEGANQQATLAGAFGGDRSQIGAAVAGNQADQTQAGFNYQAFLEAMQRAQSAAGMGLGAIGAGAFLPQQYQSGQLGRCQQALGPYGQTQTQPLYRNAGAGAIGGALAGAPLGPAGIIGGGLLGSGIFG